MRVRAAVVVAVLAGATVAAVPGVAAGATLAPPYTALSVTNGAVPGSISGGAVTVSGDALQPSQNGPKTISIGGSTRSGSAHLTVTAPAERFSTGTFPASAVPLVIQGRASCYFPSDGTVTISDVTYANDNTIASIGLDVTTQCNGEAFVVSLRYRSATPFTGVDLGPALPQIQMTLGGYRDVPVTLAATGSEPLDTISAVSLLGNEASLSQFYVTSEDCTGRTLASGQTCTATVRVLPRSAGNWAVKLAFLHDGDDTPYEVSVAVYAPDTIKGTYYPSDARRVLDTRRSIGHNGALKPGEAISLDARSWTGQTPSAVVLNLTVDRPTSEGYLTAYPSGGTRPTTSSLNFPRGWQGANLVTVPVGADGRIVIWNSAGSTSTIADLVGWYAAADNTSYRRGGGYHPTLVERLVDTRKSGRQLPPNYYLTIPVRYQNDGGDIAALSVTLTAVNTRGGGYLTAYDPAGGVPGTSTLNFTPSTGVISNAAIVKASYQGDCNGCASIAVINRSNAPVDVVLDINGYFDAGSSTAAYRFAPLASPTRIIDTRRAQGTTRFGQNATRTIAAPTSVAGYNTVALDANVTAVKPTQNTYLTVWPTYDDYPRPVASTVNPKKGQVIANHAISEVGYGNLFNIFNFAGETDVVMDVSGTFELFPPIPDDELPPQQVHATAVRVGGNVAPTTARMQR